MKIPFVCGLPLSLPARSALAAILLSTAAPAAAEVPGVHHVVVYHDPSCWAGTPANGGIWNWGDEILVLFQVASYERKSDDDTHSYDLRKPSYGAAARSVDGGESWRIEPAEKLGSPLFKNFKYHLDPKPCGGGIDFTHPDFALLVQGGYFFHSEDRGHTWNGPYSLPDFPGISHQNLTARTDYRVLGTGDCLLFLSARVPQVSAGDYRDRTFCARTRDGGATFEFMGWMTGEPLAVRSVMPSTVETADGRLVSAMRRRFDLELPGPSIRQNWIDAYESADSGRNWHFLSRVASTDLGNEHNRNGNPPALAKLPDGRLVVSYGYRAEPYGIRAKISRDAGATWSEPVELRTDARNWDLGYPRMVAMPDGALVIVYWLATSQLPEQHIEATIWCPGSRR